MERSFRLEMLGGERFSFALSEVSRQKRNRSYANASECCGVELKQKKVCGKCGVEVDAKECSRKIFKMGKHSHLIDAGALKRITEELGDQEDIVFHTVMGSEALGREFAERIDSIVWLSPAKKGERQYAEFVRVLGVDDKVIVGKGVFRGNEYEVVCRVGVDGVARLYRLVEPSQFHEKPEFDVGGVAVNPEVIAMETSLFERAKVAQYDFDAFRDSRAKVEESLIEQAVLGGEVPSVKSVSVGESKESERVAKLKAMLEARA